MTGLGTQPLGTTPLGGSTTQGQAEYPHAGLYPRPGLYPGQRHRRLFLLSAPIGHRWVAFTRTPDYQLGVALPIVSAQFVVRHMGVGTAVVETTFRPDMWAAVAPANGIVLRRDGRQEFSGRVTARQVDWDRESGQFNMKIEAAGDEILLADRLVWPDPTRAEDDQTVNNYWTFTGVASTAMLKLISDQAGPTCHPDRRVPGLVLGGDPGVGASRSWTALINSAGDRGVLDQLAAMSVASGQNLGLRMTTNAGVLTATITAPRAKANEAVFSADLSNLVGLSYREEAPTVTDAVAAGQGDLRARKRRVVRATAAPTLAWGRRVWTYIDRRDTDDDAELISEATDAVTGGVPVSSLSVHLTDSQAATYGRDWQLGDTITVYVGGPGQSKVAAIADVVREIAFEVDSTGAETITPAVGTADAKAILPGPSQKQLARIGAGLAGLKSWK